MGFGQPAKLTIIFAVPAMHTDGVVATKLSQQRAAAIVWDRSEQKIDGDTCWFARLSGRGGGYAVDGGDVAADSAAAG